MTLSPEEFLRRFLQHVLPRGFPRIRYFGWMANRTRGEMIPLCRRLLYQPSPATDAALSSQPAAWPCPRCERPMYVIERLTAAQIFFAEARLAGLQVPMTHPDRTLNPATCLMPLAMLPEPVLCTSIQALRTGK